MDRFGHWLVHVNMCEIKEVSEGIFLIDVWQFGRPKTGGIYLIFGDPPSLVESGTSLAVPRIISALNKLGVSRESVKWIFLTHIHLDHAGGAGLLLHDLPEATVVVHEWGVKHLVDPSRLILSVQAAVRERFPLYGTVVPIPEWRLRVAHDRDRFDLGKFKIRAIQAAGHAPHHLCYLEEQTQTLFSGDAAGLYLDGQLLPATPPPSFDLEQSLSTLNRLRDLKPKTLLYTHFGQAPARNLSEYATLLLTWVEKVRSCLEELEECEEATLERVVRSFQLGETCKEELEMSARGVISYLRRRRSS